VKLHFHPVEFVGGNRPACDSAIEIVLAGEWRVRAPGGFAAEDLEWVLNVLAGRSRR
jgi:hypothetical protein